MLFSSCVSAGVRLASPFNHEGREVVAITHWRLRSRRQRIEPTALVSGAPQNKACPHAGISDLASQCDKEIIGIDTLKACH
jgi:hypothetical protein